MEPAGDHVPEAGSKSSALASALPPFCPPPATSTWPLPMRAWPCANRAPWRQGSRGGAPGAGGRWVVHLGAGQTRRRGHRETPGDEHLAAGEQRRREPAARGGERAGRGPGVGGRVVELRGGRDRDARDVPAGDEDLAAAAAASRCGSSERSPCCRPETRCRRPGRTAPRWRGREEVVPSPPGDQHPSRSASSVAVAVGSLSAPPPVTPSPTTCCSSGRRARRSRRARCCRESPPATSTLPLPSSVAVASWHPRSCCPRWTTSSSSGRRAPRWRGSWRRKYLTRPAPFRLRAASPCESLSPSPSSRPW